MRMGLLFVAVGLSAACAQASKLGGSESPAEGWAGPPGRKEPKTALSPGKGAAAEGEPAPPPAPTSVARPESGGERSVEVAPAPDSSEAERGAAASADKADGSPDDGERTVAAGVRSSDDEMAEGDAMREMRDRRGSSRAKRRTRSRRRPPPQPGVKAGAADDNLQFNAFLRFLEDNAGYGLPFDASSRRIIKVLDREGRPWPGARVELRRGSRTVAVRRTYADGRTLLFPSMGRSAPNQPWALRIRASGQDPIIRPLGDHRTVEVALSAARPEIKTVPLDVAFVLDTTGSMQDEIDKLRATLNTINFQISHASPRPDVRYGMVLFRDQGDAYRTRVVPFTRDLDAFSAKLDEVGAGGGDDYPEDVQAGLEAALHHLKWGDTGVKVAFLIGDAPPHLDYGQSFTYLDAAREASERGIKIATIGASGLDKTGEVVWRQLAQQTMAPFVFLTYGEKGDSEGSPSSVSHHVGANWVADDLDAIVVRLVKQELAHWRPHGAPQRDDYFIANPSEQQTSDEVLAELFSKSAQQLVDYSVESIDARTPTILLPVRDGDRKRGRIFERRLALGLSRQGSFQLLEKDRREDMLAAVAEQMAKAYDEAQMIEVGKLMPARLAVLGTVDQGEADRLELLVKLVRLETGEVLSLSLLKIDPGLL